jgi:hypothetical protein
VPAYAAAASAGVVQQARLPRAAATLKGSLSLRWLAGSLDCCCRQGPRALSASCSGRRCV